MRSLPTIHHCLDSTVHLIAIALNVGLLFVIHKHSQSVLKHYRTVMTITCVNDLLLSISSFLNQPIIFLHDGLGIFISNGPVAGMDRSVLLWLQTAYCALVHVNIVFLPVAFVYRYFNLCSKTKMDHRLLCKVVFLPSLLSLVGILTSYNLQNGDDAFQEEASNAVQKMGWTTGTRIHMFGAPMASSRMMAQLVIYSISMNGGYCAIVWCEYRTLKTVRITKGAMRESTRKLHDELHNALLALAICPLFSSIIPSWFFVMSAFFRVNLGISSAFLTILVSIISLVNPITTCYFVRPFRRSVVSFLSGKGRSVAPSSNTGNPTGRWNQPEYEMPDGAPAAT